MEPRVFCLNASHGLAVPDLAWHWEDSAGWWNPQKTEDNSLQEWCKDVAPDPEAFITVLEHSTQKFHIQQQLEGSATWARLKHEGAQPGDQGEWQGSSRRANDAPEEEGVSALAATATTGIAATPVTPTTFFTAAITFTAVATTTATGTPVMRVAASTTTATTTKTAAGDGEVIIGQEKELPDLAAGRKPSQNCMKRGFPPAAAITAKGEEPHGSPATGDGELPSVAGAPTGGTPLPKVLTSREK